MSTVALWAVAGVLWAACVLPGWWRLALLGALAVVAAVVGGAGAGQRRLAAVLLLTALLGAVLTEGRGLLVDRNPLVTVAVEGGEAALEAVVAMEPRESSTGAWSVVRVESLDGRPARTRALLRFDDGASLPALGERLAFRAIVRRLEREGFDAHLRGLSAAVEVVPRGAVAVTGHAGPLLSASTAARERLRAAAGRHLPADDAALLTGLVTGDTRGRSPASEERFEAAGLSHLTAVSGGNVALLLAGVTGLATALRVGARGRRLTGLAAVVWFAVLARGEPSVLRATVVAVLVLVGGLVGRGSDGRHTLAAAALVLLLADPLLAGQLGFALSVTATAGVLVAGPMLAPRIPGPRAIAEGAGAAIGAQIGVTPLLLWLPDGVPLASVPANLVAVPAAAIAAAVGAGAGLVAQVSVEAAALVSLAARPALALLQATATAFAGGPRLTVHGPALALAAALILAVAARRRAPRLAFAVVVAVVVAAALPRVLPPPAVGDLTVTALDVGQGDAVLVEVPSAAGTARLLVDGGPEPDAALAALRGLRIRALDAVVLTHPHADHSGGLPRVLTALPVGALLVGPRPVPLDAALSAGETQAVARRRGVAVLPVAAGTRFPLGHGEVRVLSPPAAAPVSDDLNDESVVLRVEVGGATALLTGDAEEAAQEHLLRTPELVEAELVKVPHHGGDTNRDGFLAAVGADAALLTVGAGNRYGHPHPDVLDDLAAAQVWRTDRHGSVRVHVADGSVTVAGGWGGATYTALDASDTSPDPALRGAARAPPAPGGRTRARRPA